MQTDVVRPSSNGGDSREDSGGGSNTAATAVVHRVRKLDSNRLGASRAFGDFDYKSNAGLPPSGQTVVCMPKVAVRECTYDKDLYLILACNWIWDIMSNKEDMGGIMARCVK